MYLMHGIMNIEGYTDGKRHFISVVYAHPQKSLHSLKFLLILWSDVASSSLVNELYYTVWYILSFAVDRTNQEILDISSRALVIYLILEFGLLSCIIRNEYLAGVKDLT